MTRKVYLLEAEEKGDKQPGTVVWALAGTPADGKSTVYGEIWCTYKVRLSGTTS
jgi:adenylylsulfate kinase-like enzyme